ncbi:MAG TPA: ABC transporter permease [Candidatus Bathyarchaeia archaeon]|nr:ABC transporter permease [Candidatus Bathyarchaeia archaeon]
MSFFWKSTMASARVSGTLYWRFLNLGGLGLSFLPALLNLGVSWVLYNVLYHHATSSSFVSAANSSDYFSFVVVGSAFYVYVVATMFNLGRTMYWDRATGTLEAVMMTPASLFGYMTGRMIAAFGTTTLNLLIVFAIGALLGFHLGSLNPIVLAIALLFMVISLFGLGLIVNAVTLYFRDRVNTANTLSTLILVFSGIVAPLQLLPLWAQAIGSTVPFTYALNLLRSSLLSTGSTSNYTDLVSLGITSLAYLAIGYLLLHATAKAIRSKALYAAF